MVNIITIKNIVIIFMPHIYLRLTRETVEQISKWVIPVRVVIVSRCGTKYWWNITIWSAVRRLRLGRGVEVDACPSTGCQTWQTPMLTWTVRTEVCTVDYRGDLNCGYCSSGRRCVDIFVMNVMSACTLYIVFIGLHELCCRLHRCRNILCMSGIGHFMVRFNGSWFSRFIL